MMASGLTVALAATPVAGVWLALRGVRSGARWAGWLGLALNTALLVVLYGFVDQVRMSCGPG